MKCDNCGGAEAVVHLTQIVDNEASTSHLCEGCAAEKGLDAGTPPPNAPLTDFLAQIGKSVGADAPTTGRCPSCGLTSAQLKQTGRLGCATCYTHYEQHLRGLLRRLHGGTQHVGKILAATDPEKVDRATLVRNLRRGLQRAIDAEDFEHAAALRDQIRQLETVE